MPLDDHQQSPSSVDASEVDYYTKLADTWWDTSGPFWPLHKLNRLRVRYLRRVFSHHFGRDPDADRPLAGLSAVDIGCGGGILSESMARLGAEVLGIDVVEKNIQVARLHAQQSGLETVRYEQIEAEELAERAPRYDMVFNMEVVEHVANLSGFMNACNRLVRPGGAQSISTINRNPLAFLVAIIGAEYVLGWLPKGTHHYGKLRKPSEIKALLDQDGLSIIAQSGVRVNPINRSMSLTNFMGVNYMLVAQKPAA